MDTSRGPRADVFWFDVAPAPGVTPVALERALLAAIPGFALPSRPRLEPALLRHRVLRGEGGRSAWEIAVPGLALPPDDEPEEGSLAEEIRAEVTACLSGAGEVVSARAYAERSTPAPGVALARAAMDGEGGALSFVEDGLPGWEAYAGGSGAPEAGSLLPALLLSGIEQSRAAIPVEPGLKRVGAGHMYSGANDKAHLAYVKAYLAAREGGASPADRRKIVAFAAFQSREGSTAAINTYDNQIVTWGTGWGGLGWLGKVMARVVANEAARDLLARCGVRYRGSNSYDVVDLEAKAVVTGSKEALRAFRSSPALLHLLIYLARDPATRDAVTDAQLLTFLEGSASISGAGAIATQALFNLVAHLKHWAPGYVMGCLEWAAPQLDDASPSAARDRRLAVLIGRYFYGMARRHKWIPDWRQFQSYLRHMKEDGLDCLGEPFAQAAAPPADDPFAAAPLPPKAPAKR